MGDPRRGPGGDEGFALDAATWLAIADLAAQPAPAPVPEPPRRDLRPDWKAGLRELIEPPARRPVAPPPGGRPVVMRMRPPCAPPGWIPPVVDYAATPAIEAPGKRGAQAGFKPRDKRVPDLPALPGWRPGEPPPDLAAYRALLQAVDGPALARVLAVLEEEPLFRYAAGRWRAAAIRPDWWRDEALLQANWEVFAAVYERLTAAMATYYDFTPAPVCYVPNLPPEVLGLYMPGEHVIALSNRMLGAAFHETVAALAHQQVHAMQFDRLGRLRAGDDLPVGEASLAWYWSGEERQRGDMAHRASGIEIQADGLAEQVALVTVRLR